MSYAKEYGLTGYAECVFHVTDMAHWQAVLGGVCGYEVRHQGTADATQAAFWEADGAKGVSEILYGATGAALGQVRLVHIDGIENRAIRRGGRQWETGGIYDVDIRVRNIDAVYDQLEALNWQPISMPVRYQMGPVKVAQGELFGPDRIVFALVERIEPPLGPDAGFDQVSNAFNSTQVIAEHEFEPLTRFITDTLGFPCFLDTVIEWKATGGENIFGLPFDVAQETPARVRIFNPLNMMQGAVEICALDRLQGESYAAHASPRNKGITVLRFEVKDLDGYLARVHAAGADIAREPQSMHIAPYGNVRIFAVRLPTGAWFEFFEVNA